MTISFNLGRRFASNKRLFLFPLLAFLVPFTVRTIPEVLIGPYIVGFDTMGFYVPNTLSWLHGGVDLWSYLSVAPLFYAVLMSTVSTGLPIIIALKVISPVLLGFLGLSIYLYAHKGLGWFPLKSLVPALIGTVYFVALRISWDMLRTELGLVFFFVALTLLTQLKHGGWKRYVLLAIVLMAVILSHQLVAVILFGVVIFTVLSEWRREGFRKSINLVIASLPSVVFFVLVNFTAVAPAGLQDFSSSVGSPLASWLVFPSYSSMLVSEGGFFLYCFLPLMPLALLSIKHLGSFQLRSWLILTLLLLLVPFAFVSPYRWLILLIYPFAFYIAESLTMLKPVRLRCFKIPLQKIALLYLVSSTVILSIGYIFMPPEEPFVYFNPDYVNCYQYQIPTSMLQNTISIADLRSTTEALQWFKSSENETALLLTHTVFYSWALLSLNENQVRTYGFEEPDKAADLATRDGYTEIYVIWWINGRGWYALPTLPTSFIEVYHAGEIAIYKYDITP